VTRLVKIPVIRVATFLYHEVVTDSCQSGFQRPTALAYKHDRDFFVKNLDAIARGAAAPVTLHQLDWSSGGDYLLLTFDDGGRSALDVAAILEQRGWKGHFFVTTEMIGRKFFLSADDILDLHRRGHVIGSHSHSHPDIFYNLSPREMLDEWKTSCRILSEILGERIVAASVPGGDINAATLASACEAGLKYLFTSEPTLHPWTRENMICFGRVCVKRNTPLRQVRQYANFEGFTKAMALRKLKQATKRILSPAYRLLAALSVHRET